MNPLEVVAKHVQSCMSKVPVIVLGSGASVAHGIPGMPSLALHLAESELPRSCNSDQDLNAWNEFLERIKDLDLEAALSDIRLTDPVTDHIVETTWDFLNSRDIAVFADILEKKVDLPLSRLFAHLFGSTAREINVVTPNYDRIAEYAADLGRFCSYTGFTYGTIGHRGQSDPQVISVRSQRVRTVNIWKVHGSFGWFADSDGIVISLPPMEKRPVSLRPVIVTPGVEKYRRTHDEPFRTIMQRADDAMLSASAFLCIGYGFNDAHLQPKLVERCSTSDVQLVLITKKISDQAHAFFRSGRCKNYLAIEEDGVGVQVFSNEFANGVQVACQPLWRLDTFLSLVA